jgi:predicted NBD/HSP70 family sugar kinase
MHILFDIGGSKTRVARSDDVETIVGEPVIFPTKDSFDEQLDTLVSTAQSLLGGTKAVSVTGGIKGVYDHASGRIGKTPGKELWTWQPFAERIEAGLGVTPLVHNDTALVGMGEAHKGAGVGSERFAYISVSTGVGGVQIVHGNIVDAVYGFEPGHQIINYATGERLEGMVGGAALKARSGMEPIDIHDEAVWEREAELLAVGLHNSILHWSPDTVVLGGSMMKGIGVEGILIERVRVHVEKNLTIFPKMPEFRLAKLAQFGGLYGAMLVRSRLN